MVLLVLYWYYRGSGKFGVFDSVIGLMLDGVSTALEHPRAPKLAEDAQIMHSNSPSSDNDRRRRDRPLSSSAPTRRPKAPRLSQKRLVETFKMPDSLREGVDFSEGGWATDFAAAIVAGLFSISALMLDLRRFVWMCASAGLDPQTSGSSPTLHAHPEVAGSRRAPQLSVHALHTRLAASRIATLPTAHRTGLATRVSISQ